MMFYSLVAFFPVNKGTTIEQIKEAIKSEGLTIDVFASKASAGYMKSYGKPPICRIESSWDSVSYDDTQEIEEGIKNAAVKFADWKRGNLTAFTESDGDKEGWVYGPREATVDQATKEFVQLIRKIGKKIENLQKIRAKKHVRYAQLHIPNEEDL